MFLGFSLIVLLIALNAFFVAAEFAIIKVRYSAVETDVAAGSGVAKVSQGILDKLDKYLSAAQIGITLASLALGWIGEPVIAESIVEVTQSLGLPITHELAHKVAVPIGFVLITVLHLVFGEAIPKYAAIYYPQEFTYAVSIPLKMFALVTAPLVWIINSLTWLILTPLGIKVQSEEDTHTEEELRLLLAESAQSGEVGAIQKTEHELIEKVFKFDERVVRQIMVPRPQMAAMDVATPAEQALTVISREGYSRVPVYAGTKDNIVGILHEKELLRRVLDKQTIKISDIMRPALFVPETKKIGSLLRELQNKRSHMAIVVDEFGVASGLITLEDIVEELVGEIQDEYDDERPVVEKRKEGDFIVNAHASILDVNAHLPIQLPESAEYSTVAGFLNILFSGIPEVGESCEDASYAFKVLKTSRGSVDSVLLKVLVREESTESK
jgi:CBS domain containing-hemolysin-like protein